MTAINLERRDTKDPFFPVDHDTILPKATNFDVVTCGDQGVFYSGVISHIPS